MTSSDLPLPVALQNLIESGFWPTTEKEKLAQNVKPLVSSQQVRSLAPEEGGIFFYCPPFHSVSDCIKHGEEFWSWPMSAAHEIDPDLTLLIGDFGLGSDAPFALDYRANLISPRVIRLKWSQSFENTPPKDNRTEYKSGNHWMSWKPDNHWVEMAPDFRAFCQMLFG